MGKSTLALAVIAAGLAVWTGQVFQPRVAAAGPDTVTADLQEAPVEDALRVVSGQRSINIDTDAARRSRPVTLRLRNMAPLTAINRVARAAGLPVDVSASEVRTDAKDGDDALPKAPVLDTRLYGQTKLLPDAEAALRIVAMRHDDGKPVSGADVVLTLIRTAEPGPNGHPGFARPVFRGRTDATGTVNAAFHVPPLPAGSYELTVTTGALGERDHLAQDISVAPSAQILLTTDKPVYQPGQTIHIRALALAEPNRQPLSGSATVIEVSDGKGNKVFKRTGSTSAYGIFSADFELATELNMGGFRIRATAGTASQEKTVTVDRYVLPKFKVSFQPDQAWYKPSDTLTGVVSAQYFFGKPVGGQVKVALSTFDAGFNQFAEVSGRLDASGHFRVEQKLPDFFAGQPLEQGNAFVKADVTVTDTTDHEEKATKSVPVAAQALKVTLVPESAQIVPDVPNAVYVVTSTPDGAPIAARYVVETPNRGTGYALGGQTDASGVALQRFTPREGSAHLNVRAVDNAGHVGTASLDLESAGTDGVLLRADRALYKAGDTMALTALSPGGRATVYFDILRDHQTVLTRSANLKDGRASVSVDLGEDLTGTLEIHAYRIGRDGNIRRDTRVVYVDPANDLHIAATPDRDTYAPGQAARVRFAVTDPGGRPRPAALGISIVDESVFALQEMQPGMEKVYFLLEKEILEPRYEIHGITPQEIVSPGPVVRAEPGRQRAAGALFAALPRRDGDVTLLASSYNVKIQRVLNVAYGRLLKDAEAVRVALNEYQKGHGEYPSLSGDLVTKLVQDGRLLRRHARDPWGRAYTATALSASYRDGFTLRSPGPDGRTDTDDDLNVYVNPQYAVGMRNRGDVFFDEDGRAFPMEQRAWGLGGVGRERLILRNGPMPPAAPEGAVRGIMLDNAKAPIFKDDAFNGDKPADAAVRVREYFPETLLFRPALITDDRGIAMLDVPMADSITTWRMTAMASSRNGALGSVTAPLKAFQDFFVDINFPVRLTQGDEVSVPVSVYNYLPRPQTVTLTADREGWFELLDDPTRSVTIGPNEVKGVKFRIRVTGLGFQKLTIRAKGTSRSDAVRREVEVVPNGKRIEEAVNGRLTDTVHQTIHIPDDSVTGASNILVKVYPGLFSSVVEGMDKILQMPYGCFEQTSSTTYPNVLALGYMKRTNRITPEVQMKAEQYVNLGYQRLLSYEVPGGGFSWFGTAPANKVLTAYGLQEFADMSAVWDVDAAMIARTRDWEGSQQNADGSWTPDKDYIDEGLGPMWKSNLLSTAYVTWGMAESGRAIKATGDAPVQKALNYLRGHADEAKDPYALAVLANALVAAAPEDPATKQVIDRLLAARTDGANDQTSWKTEQGTMTFAGGDSAEIETTALAALALIRSGEAPDVATRALNFLIAKRDANGTWGSTQGTVLALRAILGSLGAQVQRGSATIRVMVNGSEAGVIQVTPENADVMQQVDAKAFVQPGDNRVDLLVEGKGQMMYGITAYHYAPWDSVKPPRGPMDITVKYDRTRLQQDETLTAAVSIAYNPAVMPIGGPGNAVMPIMPRSANMVVVDLGIPPGFTVQDEDLKGLVDNKVITRYETTGRQVILYFDKISAGQPVTFNVQMRAQYPLRAKTPESVVYQYYNPALRAIAQPVALEVTG